MILKQIRANVNRVKTLIHTKQRRPKQTISSTAKSRQTSECTPTRGKAMKMKAFCRGFTVGLGNK